MSAGTGENSSQVGGINTFYKPFPLPHNSSVKRLMNVFFYARYKVEPPGLIKLENEIEQEEKAPEPPSSPISPAQGSALNKSSSCRKSTGKLLDDAVSMISSCCAGVSNEKSYYSSQVCCKNCLNTLL